MGILRAEPGTTLVNTFRVHNLCDTDLNVRGAQLTSELDAMVLLDDLTGAVIPAEGSLDIAVSFTSDGAYAMLGEMVLLTDDDAMPAVGVTMYGLWRTDVLRAGNGPLHPDAGPDQTGEAGVSTSLTGTADGGVSSFRWRFHPNAAMLPAGTGFSGTLALTANTSFIPDVSGNYPMWLVVSDGLVVDRDFMNVNAIDGFEECTSASVISEAGSYGPFDTTGTTLDPLPGAGGDGGHYFEVVAASTGLMTLSTCNGVSDFDTRIVHKQTGGTCADMNDITFVDQNDDDDDGCADGGLLSTLNVSVTAGQSYWIAVNGFDGGEVGIYQLDVSYSTGNLETCPFATVIHTTGTGSSGPFDTTGTLLIPDAGVGASAGHYFKIVPLNDGDIVLTTCNAVSDYDTRIVYKQEGSGCVDLETSDVVDQNDDSCSGFSGVLSTLTITGATANTPYYVAVNGFENGDEGIFQLDYTMP